MRAVAAGVFAVAVGTAIGTAAYFRLPGALQKIDWDLMLPILIGYAGITGVLAGLGLGGGMLAATRGQGRRVGLVRLLLGSITGALVGCTLPAMAGIGGFGSVCGPYAGTANLLSCILLGATVFVAVWGPQLDRESKLRTLPRLALSALSSILASATLGTLFWLLHQQVGIVPSFEWMAEAVNSWGMVTFAAIAGSVVAVGVGLLIGLATWLYLTMAIAFDR